MSVIFNPNSNSFGQPQGTTEGTFITPILIGDVLSPEESAAEGLVGTDNTPQPTQIEVDGQLTQVSAALEIQSQEGSVLFPRIPTATYQTSSDFISCDGMMLYDSTIGSMIVQNSGQWQTVGNGDSFATQSVTVDSTTSSIPTLFSAGIQLVEPNTYSTQYPNGYMILPTLLNIFAKAPGITSFFTGGSDLVLSTDATGSGGVSVSPSSFIANLLYQANVFINSVSFGFGVISFDNSIQNNGVTLTSIDNTAWSGGPSSPVNLRFVLDYKVIPIYS